MASEQIRIYTCDKCKKKIGNEEQTNLYRILIGKGTDAAGSSEDITADVDLCKACNKKFILEVMAQLKPNLIQTIVEDYGGHSFPRRI